MCSGSSMTTTKKKNSADKRGIDEMDVTSQPHRRTETTSLRMGQIEGHSGVARLNTAVLA